MARVISRRQLLRRVASTGVATAAVQRLGRAATDAGGEAQSAETRRADGLIRLDKNEDSYGPSPKVAAVLQKSAGILANRYPERAVTALRAGIADAHAVAPEQIVVGCGSADVLRMAVTCLAGPGKNVVAAVPTCELIERLAGRVGAAVEAVPLDNRYAHDLEGMLARIDASTGLVYICNPNNPTGSLTSRQQIEDFLRRRPASVHVLIDEAYHHYVSPSLEYASFLDRPAHDPRVIVVRSFSKIHGLAGLRVGYGVAAPETSRLISASQLENGVNTVGAAAALAALGDTEHLRRRGRQNADDRQEFFNQASARMLKPIDSHTNFVMFDTDRPAITVIDHFRKNGIAIAGHFPYFAKFIRVSLGTASDMAEFWRVWDLMPRRKMAM